MSEKDNPKPRRTGTGSTRRDVLKSGAAVGGLGGLLTVSGSGADRVRVVTARGGRNNEVRDTERVPKRWKAHTNAIQNKIEIVAPTILARSFVNSVSLTTTDLSEKGYTYSKIAITVDEGTRQELKNELPSDLSDLGQSDTKIQLQDFEIREGSRDVTSLCETGVDDKTHECGWRVWSGNNQFGTAGYPMEDSAGKYLLTANHVFADVCNGTPKYDCENDNHDRIGDYDSNNVDHDWVAMKVEQDGEVENITNYIWYDGGASDAFVDGYKNETGIAAMLDDVDRAKSQGSTTGYTEGTVTDHKTYKITPCYSMDGYGVKTKIRVGEGDSGGPIFDLRNGNAYAVTFNSFTTSSSVGTKQCAGYSNKLFDYNHGFGVYPIPNNTSYSIGISDGI